MPTRKIGRDAHSGRFISVEQAQEHPGETVVETIHVSRTGIRRHKRRRAVRHLTEENQNETGTSFKAGRDL